jgi:hypothetical protein
MAVSPVRLRLSRRAGFRLQEVSRAINGLTAVPVSRPSRWGNPFSVEKHGRATALALYESYLKRKDGPRRFLDPSNLRGKNLACWCALDQACHADILLQWANP